MPEGGGAAVEREEALDGVGVLGDDAGRERGGLGVRDPHRLGEVVDDVERHGRDARRVARPLVADRLVQLPDRHDGGCAGGPDDLDAALLAGGDELGRQAGGLPVDEGEVEPVADAEPVEAGVDDRRHAIGACRAVDVEDAAALGVGERAHAVVGREARERRRRGAAAAQDHERNPVRERDERLGAGAIGRAHEPDRARVDALRLERRSQHLVDQRLDRRERRAAGAEDDRVQALQHLRRDVERHAGPRLEVRPDRPDRDSQLAHLQPVRERSARDLPLERLERRGRLELARERREARLVQAEPVERSLVELLRGRLHVSLVRREHVSRPLLEQLGRPPERRPDRCVVERRQRRCRRDRLSLDELANHALLCTLQTARRGRDESRSASREVEGSGPTTPRQPASAQGANRPSSPLGSM